MALVGDSDNLASLWSGFVLLLAMIARRWQQFSLFLAQASWVVWDRSLPSDSWPKLEWLSAAGLMAGCSPRAGTQPIMLRLYQLGRLLYPEPTLGSLKNRLSILASGLVSRRELRAWYGIDDNPLLAAARAAAPRMDCLLFWPYIHKDWDRRRRLEVVDGHYRLAQGRAAVLARCIGQEVELLGMNDAFPGLRLVLDRPLWFMREGEVVINLFQGSVRLYSLAFSLGVEDGVRVAYVGALQGSNAEAAPEIYREMTHRLHGLRPRDLLMACFKNLCASMGVASIRAVCGNARHHNSSFYGKAKKEQVLVDYDEIWSEHGGSESCDGFCTIDAVVRHRDMSEIPSKKRAMYRRRYEFLDALAIRIDAAVQAGAAA